MKTTDRPEYKSEFQLLEQDYAEPERFDEEEEDDWEEEEDDWDEEEEEELWSWLLAKRSRINAFDRTHTRNRNRAGRRKYEYEYDY